MILETHINTFKRTVISLLGLHICLEPCKWCVNIGLAWFSGPQVLRNGPQFCGIHAFHFSQLAMILGPLNMSCSCCTPVLGIACQADEASQTLTAEKPLVVLHPYGPLLPLSYHYLWASMEAATRKPKSWTLT